MADKPTKNLFSRIKERLFDIGREAKRSLQWYMANIKSLPQLSKTPESILRDADKSLVTNSLVPGRMYFFVYDAKWKDELPYWDAFPLILPFRKVPHGFYGINLHYLNYKDRFALLNALQNIAADNDNNQMKKIKLSSELLIQFSRLAPIKHTVKHYLDDHVRSHFVTVRYSDWITASLLPVERFQKARKEKVWLDGRS